MYCTNTDGAGDGSEYDKFFMEHLESSSALISNPLVESSAYSSKGKITTAELKKEAAHIKAMSIPKSTFCLLDCWRNAVERHATEDQLSRLVQWDLRKNVSKIFY